jgi:site-specific DNA-methyltransferase (adenine-specific)
MTARFIVADVFDGLASLPDDSVDLVFTSPPFLALRSYLPADHPDKAKEIGSEATPAEFIDTLLDVTEACARVLAPHGSLCFELGDTFSGSGGAGGDYGWDRLGARAGQDDQPPNYRRKGQVFAGGKGQAARAGWPLGKSLCLIPESFRWALAYGRNPFNGRETEPWRVRNVVRWCRPNPPVGALGDKFRPSTSEIVVACKSRTRYFDLDAVRTVPTVPVHWLGGRDQRTAEEEMREGWKPGPHQDTGNPAGVPPLDHWIIPTAPFKGDHYATFPPALVTKPVLAMCPERVCTVCGEPSRRIVKVTRVAEKDDSTRAVKAEEYRLNGQDHPPEVGWEMNHETLGWTDCGHDSWRRGVVLDPFAGSGTVLAVATGHGRDAIGIDLDSRNSDLARERVGMFLTVEELATEAVS